MVVLAVLITVACFPAMAAAWLVGVIVNNLWYAFWEGWSMIDDESARRAAKWQSQ